MKFCPKCGTQLPDEARFCNKCGAPQPDFANEAPIAPQPAQSQPQVQQQAQPQMQQPMQQPANTQMTPSQRFNHLFKTDERFKDIVKGLRRGGLINLFNLLFIIPFMVCMFTPVGAFTGVNVSGAGHYAFEGLGVTSFPYGYSAFTIRSFASAMSATGYKLTPDDALKGQSITTMMSFIFCFLFFALMVVVSLVGNPRGYILKTYEKENGYKELIQRATGGTIFLFGPFYAALGLICAIFTYVNSTGQKYKSGDNYYFGEVTGLKEGLITCIVVASIFIVIMLVAQIVLKKAMNSKLKRYLKQE